MNRLKEIREKYGLTLDDIASQTGINRGSYNNYENGKSEPKLEVLKKLAKFYDVSVSYLQGLTFSELDILKVLNDDYLTGDIPFRIKGEVDDFLISQQIQTPLMRFEETDLKKFGIKVQNYWKEYFDFLFIDFDIKKFIKYGGSKNELLEALYKAIRKRKLSITETTISKVFDNTVGDELTRFNEYEKDNLLRYGSEEEIRSKTNELIEALTRFNDTLALLPANQPKPTDKDVLPF